MEGLSESNDSNFIMFSDLCSFTEVPKDLYYNAMGNLSAVQASVLFMIYFFSLDMPEKTAMLSLDDMSDFLFISKAVAATAVNQLASMSVIDIKVRPRGRRRGKYSVNMNFSEWKKWGFNGYAIS